jgi:hypothetical protein
MTSLQSTFHRFMATLFSYSFLLVEKKARQLIRNNSINEEEIAGVKKLCFRWSIKLKVHCITPAQGFALIEFVRQEIGKEQRNCPTDIMYILYILRGNEESSVSSLPILDHYMIVSKPSWSLIKP